MPIYIIFGVSKYVLIQKKKFLKDFHLTIKNNIGTNLTKILYWVRIKKIINKAIFLLRGYSVFEERIPGSFADPINRNIFTILFIYVFIDI